MRIFLALLLLFLCSVPFAQTYSMPGEHLQHEGTWIAWPHNNEYGPWYIDDVQPTSVALADALQEGENVHIIVLDADHENQAKDALSAAGVPLTNLYFHYYPTNDLWTRDNGPMFVFSNDDELTILDWGFNGWGEDTEYDLDDNIPYEVYSNHSLPYIDLNDVVLEGGAIEQDGNGTLIATRSSVTHSSRNPGLSETEIEDTIEQYIGATNIIWLDGVYGLELTDQHIDGFVKFANETTIVTMDSTDLIEWDVLPTDISALYNAVNSAGDPYNFEFLPLTQNTVTTTYDDDLGYKGSYINYYIGNEVIVVPTYNDPNDAVAISIIEGIHSDRTVIGVDVRDLYAYGGMIHCITQQRPFDPNGVGIEKLSTTGSQLLQNLPNPAAENTRIPFNLNEDGVVLVKVMDVRGRLLKEVKLGKLNAGEQETLLDLGDLENGTYFYSLILNNVYQGTRAFQIRKK